MITSRTTDPERDLIDLPTESIPPLTIDMEITLFIDDGPAITTRHCMTPCQNVGEKETHLLIH